MNYNPKFRILKRLSPMIENRKDIFAFDVETQQKDMISERGLKYVKQKFLMGSICGDGFNNTYWDKKKMQKTLLSKLTKNSLIYATNLDFDFKILYDDYNLKDFTFIERAGSSIIISRRKYHGKKLTKYSKRKYNQWMFLDTLNYSKAGVAQLAKMFNLKKLDLPKCLGKVPKNDAEKKELEEYNRYDSYITYRFAIFMRQFCNDMKCKLKATIASIGIDYWRRNHLEKDIFQERRHIIDKHYQGSMKGGRTEVFKRGLFKDVFYYDFNSMYPSACYDGVDKKGSYPNPSSVHTVKDAGEEYIWEFEGISKAKVFCPYMYAPLLGVHDISGKLFFPQGEFQGWFTHIELRRAIELGYKILEVYDTIYYTEMFNPFRESVKTLYALRQKYKQEKNRPMEQMIKILMNSALFGKFAQKIDNKTECYHIKSLYSENDGQCHIEIDGRRIELHDFRIRGDYVFDTIDIPMKIPIFILPILASYTTASARIKLHRYLHKYNENIIYCDTDSLILSKDIHENSSKLGELKMECEVPEAIIVRPKQYYYSTRDNKEFVKIKGVLKKCVKTKKDFFKESFQYSRFTKTKESAIRRIPYGSIIDVDKHISLEDDKRNWPSAFSYDMSQDSKPLFIKQEEV